jgi:hypothetical protein
VKEVEIVVVQSEFGEDIVALTDPFPPADVAGSNVPFR